MFLYAAAGTGKRPTSVDTRHVATTWSSVAPRAETTEQATTPAAVCYIGDHLLQVGNCKLLPKVALEW